MRRTLKRLRTQDQDECPYGHTGILQQNHCPVLWDSVDTNLNMGPPKPRPPSFISQANERPSNCVTSFGLVRSKFWKEKSLIWNLTSCQQMSFSIKSKQKNPGKIFFMFSIFRAWVLSGASQLGGAWLVAKTAAKALSPPFGRWLSCWSPGLMESTWHVRAGWGPSGRKEGGPEGEGPPAFTLRAWKWDQRKAVFLYTLGFGWGVDLIILNRWDPITENHFIPASTQRPQCSTKEADGGSWP